MFQEHAREVLHQVDAKKFLTPHGTLTEKVDLLTLVKKKKNIFFFPNEYEVVPATLGDLVPAFAEFSDFEETTLIKDYTHTGLISGRVDAQTAVQVVDVDAKASVVKETSSVDINAKKADFCKMKEICPGQEINRVHMPTLREGEVLGFVSKIVFNTNEIHLHGRTEVEGFFSAILKFIRISLGKSNSFITLGTSATFCRYDVKDESFVVTEKIEGKMEDDTSFTVPAGQTYGYRFSELKFKEEKVIGMINSMVPEQKHIVRTIVEPETFDPDDSTEETLETLQQVRKKLLVTETVLQPLDHLPRVTRFALFQSLSVLSEDRDALTLLKLKLDQWRAGEQPEFCSVCSVLHLLSGSTTPPSPTGPETTDSTLEAVYLLVSAMDKLPEHVTLLIAKKHPDTLRGLNQLVSSLMENGQAHLSESLPAALQDGGQLHWLAMFLCSFDESLRELSELRMVAGVLLLALCVAVRGLSMLQQ